MCFAFAKLQCTAEFLCHKSKGGGSCVVILWLRFVETFWTNPQYRVEVVDADDDASEQLGTVLVACLQKNRRRMRKEGVDLLTIGYSIYQVQRATLHPHPNLHLPGTKSNTPPTPKPPPKTACLSSHSLPSQTLKAPFHSIQTPKTLNRKRHPV